VLDVNDKPVTTEPASGFEFTNGESTFTSLITFPSPGDWKLGIETRAVKPAERLGDWQKFHVSQSFVQWTARVWPWLVALPTAALILFNVALIVVARRSPTALRLLADDALTTRTFLIVMLILRFWRPAQLWLLDLYFQNARQSWATTHPFLSLPVKRSDGKQTDALALARGWGEQSRIWVQGNTGMGKTALFRYIAGEFFSESFGNVFTAYRKFGFVLLPIEARRYPGSAGDDKRPHAWVLGAVRDALESYDFAVNDRSFVVAILKGGTLALAIDGLNEIDKGPAIIAFAQLFPRVKIFVTSQDPAEPPFQDWRLPTTIQDHVDNFITAYLGREKSFDLSGRLREAGLTPHLRSGYDLQLVIGLSGPSSKKAFPANRESLYGAYVEFAWPESDSRLSLMEAAAWRTLSRSGPNQDKRRLAPGIDAPKDLLKLLSLGRQQGENRVRLVRPAGTSYEFVHDQMNAYLAARWLIQELADISTVLEEIRNVEIWRESRETQESLWTFVSSLVDRDTLESLWLFSADEDRRVVLRRSLESRAAIEGWALTLQPRVVP
jgi:hypothetical protein